MRSWWDITFLKIVWASFLFCFVKCVCKHYYADMCAPIGKCVYTSVNLIYSRPQCTVSRHGAFISLFAWMCVWRGRSRDYLSVPVHNCVLLCCSDDSHKMRGRMEAATWGGKKIAWVAMAAGHQGQVRTWDAWKLIHCIRRRRGCERTLRSDMPLFLVNL